MPPLLLYIAAFFSFVLFAASVKNAGWYSVPFAIIGFIDCLWVYYLGLALVWLIELIPVFAKFMMP